MTYYFPNYFKTFCVSALVSLSAGTLAADDLESAMTFRILDTSADGEETLVERLSVEPGEVIHYTLSHENKTEHEMQGLIVAAPVPEGVTLSLGGNSTSVPAVFEIQADLDPELEGLEWTALPAMRKVVEADGNLREEELPIEEVRAVRWSLSEALAAGEVVLTTYRVRVN